MLADSIADTLYLIPFLFVTYLAMEWLEHRTGAKTQAAIRRAGKAGPVIGAFLGVVPQCGFSAVASTLWAGRVITLGTLFAVFLSTSDEMLPVFLAEQVPLQTILFIMGMKVVIGLAMGFAVDALIHIARPAAAQKTAAQKLAAQADASQSAAQTAAQPAAVQSTTQSAAQPPAQLTEQSTLRIHELCKQDNCHCTHNCATCEKNPELVYSHHDDCTAGCTHEHHEHDHSHDSGWTSILKCSLKHTVQVTVFIFVITIALNAVFAAIGEEALAELLANNAGLSVFASALVGLIPNCAASVCIAQLYVEGILGTGAMLSGLLVSAGVGLLVMCRANRRPLQNACIIATLYVMGVLWGLVINAIGIVF